MPAARFRPLALQDIRESFVWLENNAGETVASRFFDSVRQSVESVGIHALDGFTLQLLST